jgi:cation:H+ antiporter
MLHSLPIFALVGIFVVAAAMVWGAGIWLSDTTDTLSSRFHLGQALAGTILLAVGTNLPELAVTSTAAVHHNLCIAVGNLLGGIAIQTVVLAALDIAVRGNRPLTYRAASITLVLESVLVVAVLAVAILGTRLAPSLVLWRITPQNLLILLIWLGGLWLLKRAPQHMPWILQHSDAQQKPAGHSQDAKNQKSWKHGKGDGQVWHRGHRYPWRRHCA